MYIPIPWLLVIISSSACIGFFIHALCEIMGRTDENTDSAFWREMYFQEKENNEGFKVIKKEVAV